MTAEDNRTMLLRQQANALSQHALRIPTKLALQGSLLMETPGMEGARIYVPIEKRRQVVDELLRNFQYQFNTYDISVWSQEADHGEGAIIKLAKIDLPEFVAKPVKDGIQKDTIKFASAHVLENPVDEELKLGEILDQRIRQKS